MAGPSLIIPVGADITKFQSAMNETTSLASKVTLAIAKQTIQMSAGFLASQGAAGAATIAFGRMLGALGPVLLGITAITDAFKLMRYATELAKAKIEEFNAVAAAAGATGFSTEFFQRVVNSAGQARDKIDDITEALKNFNRVSTDKLGGSDLQKRLDELQKAGNASGLSIVGNDAEGKLRSVVSLIDQMVQKGERLAALDLTETAFGSAVAAAMRADSGYLDDMLKRADALSKSKIISDEDLGRALELKRRMEDAQKILAERWKPVQDDLAKLGENYYESWASIVERIAEAVDLATQLYLALKQVPDWFAKKIGGASIWSAITEATTTPESRAAAEASFGISSDPKDIAMVGAHAKLGAALKNYQAMTAAMRQAEDVGFAVRGDTSREPKKTITETNDAVDAAINTLRRHTEQVEADTKAVGLGDEALARFKAQAQETAAVAANGGKETSEQAAAFKLLQDRAAAAAKALAEAQLASDISRGRQTAFLTPEDSQIANQLKGLYGDDIPAALASSEAAALRFNNAVKQVGELGQDINRSFLVDFESKIRSGASAMDALKTAGVNALGKIADKLAGMAADNLWSAAFGGSGGLGGLLGGLLGGSGGPTGSITVGSQSFPKFASGTDSAPGGMSLVGENGPEVLNIPRGSQIIPNDVLRSGGGAITVNARSSIVVQGSADAKTLELMRAELARRDAQLPMRVVAAVRDAKARRVLA